MQPLTNAISNVQIRKRLSPVSGFCKTDLKPRLAAA